VPAKAACQFLRIAIVPAQQAVADAFLGFDPNAVGTGHAVFIPGSQFADHPFDVDVRLGDEIVGRFPGGPREVARPIGVPHVPQGALAGAGVEHDRILRCSISFRKSASFRLTPRSCQAMYPAPRTTASIYCSLFWESAWRSVAAGSIPAIKATDRATAANIPPARRTPESPKRRSGESPISRVIRVTHDTILRGKVFQEKSFFLGNPGRPRSKLPLRRLARAALLTPESALRDLIEEHGEPSASKPRGLPASHR